jgi:hypothetical protein
VTPCTWTTLSSGLPRVAVLSLKLHEPSRTLRAATHGRGAWDLALNNFTFSGPHLSAITAPAPASANSGGTQFTLTVNGSGLTGGTIQFGGTALSATGTASDTSLSGIVPTALLATGTVQITVQVGSATSNSLAFPILGGAPTITSITPSSTPVQLNPSTNVTIQLAGTNFTSNPKVLFNGAQNGITVLLPGSGCALPTCLKATLPASLLGPYGSTNDVAVFVPPPGGGQSAAKQFKVAAPAPPNDAIGNAINVTDLYYIDTEDTSGATTEASDPTPPCVTQFSAAQGNTGGQLNGRYNTIWYKFTPQFSANVQLTTDYFASSYDTVLSIWSGSPTKLNNIACNDDIAPGVIQSQLLAIPLSAGTTYYMMVSSFGPPDPNPVALGGFSGFQLIYNGGVTPTPTLSSISPASVKSGDPAVTLTVVGSGFLNGASVLFVDPSVGITTEPTVFVSPTQLTATIPANAILLPGTYQVEVTNPLPSSPSSPLNLVVDVGTYPVPTLSLISPNSAVAGTLQPVTIFAAGTNLASNAVLNFNGTAEQITSFGHGSLQAVVPPSALANPGSVQVTVSNPTPGGGPSNSLPFTISVPNPVPTITAINPNSTPVNTAIPVSITGTGFLYGASVCVAFPSGLSCNPAAYISSTQLSANVYVNSIATGTYPLYVVDPAPGGTSAPFSFAVTGPPDFSITAGGTTSVTVPAGTTANFTNAITVAALNGFSSAVMLTCSLPASATKTNCTVSPNSFTTGSGTASVAVGTTSRGFVLPPGLVWRVRPVPYALPAMLLMCLLILLQLARTRRQKFAKVWPAVGLFLLVLIQMGGCGGGGGYTVPPPPPPTGTPAGTYTVTVTATSGNLTHTTTLSLTVQ